MRFTDGLMLVGQKAKLDNGTVKFSENSYDSQEQSRKKTMSYCIHKDSLFYSSV